MRLPVTALTATPCAARTAPPMADAGLLAPRSACAGQSSAGARKSVDILRCDSFSHTACGRDFTYWSERFGYASGQRQPG